jgi:hypothetical protein
MDLKTVGMGVVIFLVFWAFQAGYFNSLGNAQWSAAVVVFSVLLIIMGKLSMPKVSADMKMLWNFAIGFAVVSTLIFSFALPYIGFVTPLGFNLTALTPVVVGLWLIVFGGAHFVTGWQSKMNVALLVGLIWLFSAVPLMTLGGNSYIYFGWVTGLSFVIAGLLRKK